MIKKKRGQGLSINVIILAVLGLIVLVVLIFIFSKESGESVSILESCDGRGGKCREINEGGCKASEFRIPGEDLCSEGQVCCKRIFDSGDDKTDDSEKTN